MKKMQKNWIIVLIIGISMILALAISTTNVAASHTDILADSVSQVGPATQYQITPTPTPEGISQPGSTDAIMLMGIIIAVIILLPIVFRRSTWTK